MKKTLSLILILSCFCSPLLLKADVSEKFLNLQKVYAQALRNVETTYTERAAKLEANGIQGLTNQANQFRADGQISTYLEAKKYLNLYDRHLLDEGQLSSFQSDFIKDFHRNFESARAQLEEDEQEQLFQIMNVMQTHLQQLATESTQEKNTQLLSVIQSELKSIESNEQYQISAQKAREKYEAKSNPPQVVQVQPISIPTPFAVKTKPLLDVDVSKKAMSQHAEGWDYDDKVQNIHLAIKVRSKELRRDYEKLTVKIWAFGQDVNSKKKFRMQIVERLKVDGLLRGHTVELESKTFENVYDNTDYAKFGHKFYGYLLIIEDKDGEELFRKASPSRLEGDLKKIESMSEGEDFKL